MVWSVVKNFLICRNNYDMGRPVAQSVEQAPHIQRLCPCAADLGSIPPVALCCMSFCLSFPCFLSTPQLSCIIKAQKPQKISFKKTTTKNNQTNKKNYKRLKMQQQHISCRGEMHKHLLTAYGLNEKLERNRSLKTHQLATVLRPASTSRSVVTFIDGKTIPTYI